jgi:transcriptional antiterminator RfaH
MQCQSAITTEPHWYVIQTKPRQEAIAEANLNRQSFEVYYPQILEPRRCRGKWKESVQPLFPRYLFAHLNLTCDNIAPIRSTHGVTKMVKFGELIRPVPDGFIQQLQQAEDPLTGLHKPDLSLFKKGDEVVIVSGPFSGQKGVFQATNGAERVVILLELLGRTNAVIVNQHDLTPASNTSYL